jgi:FkbM family methyltransferase
MSATLWLDSKAGREDEEVLRRFLRPGDTFVDVGANIGSLSLAAASMVGPAGRVFAIEAHPRTHLYLCRNIAFNRARNVTAFHCAAGSIRGEVSFSDRRADDQNQVGAGDIRIPVRPLDDIIPLLEVRHVSLLKIDVEGYEKFVLEGARQVLARTDAVYFEACDEHCGKYDYRLDDVIGMLQNCGFEIRYPDGRPILDSFPTSGCHNLLAVKSSAV